MTSKSVNLVSDLRDLSSHRDVPNEAWNLADQAADEIERLQSDLERSMANHTADLNGSVLALQAEIERLRAAPRDPKSLLEQFDNAAAFRQFEEYVIKNHPRDCVIARSEWHAAKLWRSALYALTMNPKIHPEAASPKFTNVSCSQCGRDFGPGEHGYSHCSSHEKEPQR